MAAITTAVHAFASFHKTTGKLAFRMHYLRGTIPHSSLLLLFSFSLFSVMPLLSFPHIFHPTFPIYISLPWVTFLHVIRVRLFFFFPFFSVLSLLYLTMHNKEIQKEVFFRTPNVYMAITTFLKIKSSS